MASMEERMAEMATALDTNKKAMNAVEQRMQEFAATVAKQSSDPKVVEALKALTDQTRTLETAVNVRSCSRSLVCLM